MAKGAKKKVAQVNAKCLCSATKTYAVDGEATSRSMEEFALQSRSVTEAQTVTIEKSKATFKPIGKEKAIPKVPYKEIVEMRQFNTDLKICVLRAEKKKTGRLLMLNFSSEDECKNFVSLVKHKNSKVTISISKTQSEQTIHDNLATLRESNGTTTLSLPPSPVRSRQSSPISTKRQSLKPNIADSSSDHGKLASVPSTQLKTYADSQNVHQTGIPKIETRTTISAWNVSFITRGTSPLSVSINQQQTSQVHKEPLISRGTEMVNRRKKSSSSSPRISTTENECKSESEKQMSQRYYNRSSSGSLRSLSLGRQKKLALRSCENDKSTGKSFSSNSFISCDMSHQKHSTLRSRQGSVNRRISAASSNSSSKDWVRQNKTKSRGHGRRVHKVPLSRESSYSSIDFKQQGKSSLRDCDATDSKFVMNHPTNRKFQNNGQASKEDRRQLGNKKCAVHSSLIDPSSFSLTRISASRKSVTSLYSFGVLNPFSTSILSHRLPSLASSQSGSSSSVSTSSRSSNGSDTSYTGNSVSEAKQRTHSLNSSYHSRHYKRPRDPSRQITIVR